MPSEELRSRLGGGSLSVDALRRSSSLISPTRTLRITEAEQSSRENTPLRVTAEALSSRPRSNPRTRTPRRYESPLNPGEFRRESLEQETVVIAPPANEARRISIRPLAGTAVGTVASTTRIHEGGPSSSSKSRKQGPSHRKIQRYHNEHFTGLASEIASSSSRGRAVAEVLLQAQAERHLFQAVYNPSDSTSEALSRFLNDVKLRDLRDRFFEGELPSQQPLNLQSTRLVQRQHGELTLQDRMNRVDARLRRVVIKAVTNSYPAAEAVKKFETFVVMSFACGGGLSSKDEDWDDLLLEPPTVTERLDSSKITAQFYFDPESPTGGFHRLLLHAVCQFHGLDACSRIVNIQIRNKMHARTLTAKGKIDSVYSHRLLDACVGEKQAGLQPEAQTESPKRTDGSWTLV